MRSTDAAEHRCLTRRGCDRKVLPGWHDGNRRVYAIGVYALRYSIEGARSPVECVRRTSVLALALSAVALAAPAQARRLALVISNHSYQNVQPLKNSRADSKAIAAELKDVGFAVTLKQDLTQKAMKSALRDFKAQVAGGDEVVFYFSGHGVQFGGTNYLIPVDITADCEAQVADDAVPLQRILDDLTDQKARFSLAIIAATLSRRPDVQSAGAVWYP